MNFRFGYDDPVDRPNAEGSGEPSPDQEHPAAGHGNKRLRIVTRCSTLDEFFVTFGAFADESSLFIVTNKPRALGLVQPFVIQLKDGATIMRGEVEVIQSTADGQGPEGRNGMRLKFLQADEATREVLRRLLEHADVKRSIAPPPGEPPGPIAVATPAQSAETTQLSGAPARAPVAKPQPPGVSPASPSSTTQISPQTEAAPWPDRSGSVTVARPTPDVPARSSSEPMAGERAPGAAYQLPANPFESITAEALESFIECTLYEERMPRPGEAPIETSVIFALPTSPASVYPPPTLPAAGTHAELPPGVAPRPPPGHAAPSPPTFSAGAPPTFGAPAGPPGPPGAPHPGVVRDAVLLAAAIQAASVPATTPARRPWLFGLTAVVSSVASLVAAYMVWGRAPDPPVPPPVSTQIVSEPPVTAPPTRPAAPSAAPTASAAPTSTLPRECRTNVRSYPDGASILWNGEPIGTTPLSDAAVPCGPARVTFQLRGFEAGERSAGPVVGKAAGVFLRLTPVRVPVDITSTPAGAQILIDGRLMGRTPATITMIGPRESKILIRVPGYKPWTRSIIPEQPRSTVHADLEKK